MRNEKKNSASGVGIGTTGLLGVAFVVLKLCGVIEWSWWWVLSPFWIPLSFYIGVCLAVILYTIIHK